MAGLQKAKLYQRYPAANILIYNGSIVLHYALGGIGIIVGYGLQKKQMIAGPRASFCAMG